MIRAIKVAVLQGTPSESNRQKTLKAIQQFRHLQAETERICKEKGIVIPEMVCNT